MLHRHSQVNERRKKSFSKPLNHQTIFDEKLQLTDIVEFWAGPSAYFIKKRLGVSIWENEQLLPENERLDLNPLEDASIKRKIIQKFVKNETSNNLHDNLYEELKKASFLPPGNLGKALNDSFLGEVQVIVNREPLFNGKTEQIFMGSVKIENLEIEGKSCPLFDNTQVLFYPSKLKGKNCMEGLVQHLWINSSKEHAGRIQTLILTRPGLLISKRMLKLAANNSSNQPFLSMD